MSAIATVGDRQSLEKFSANGVVYCMETLNDALDDGLNIYPQMCVCYQVPILRHHDSYK